MITTPTPLLFVDDEPRVLEAMRRSFRMFRKEWDASFAASGAEALEMMRARRFDVVVTDMRMPQMGGAELLARVCAEHPSTMRVVLSGQTDFDAAVRSVALAHQFLGKPCAPQALAETLGAMRRAVARIDDDATRDALIAVEGLPVCSAALHQLDALLARPDLDVSAVADVVAGDVALAVKALQVAQSTFFGGRIKKGDARTAVKTLGVSLLRELRDVAFQEVRDAGDSDADFEEAVGRLVAEKVGATATSARSLGGALLGLWGVA